MFSIPNEDAYWEWLREKWESKSTDLDSLSEDEPICESGYVFLDDETDEIEAERGFPMEELYEGDLLEILEEMKGISAETAVWNPSRGAIEYHKNLKSKIGG